MTGRRTQTTEGSESPRPEGSGKRHPSPPTPGAFPPARRPATQSAPLRSCFLSRTWSFPPEISSLTFPSFSLCCPLSRRLGTVFQLRNCPVASLLVSFPGRSHHPFWSLILRFLNSGILILFFNADSSLLCNCSMSFDSSSSISFFSFSSRFLCVCFGPCFCFRFLFLTQLAILEAHCVEESGTKKATGSLCPGWD